MSGLGLGYIRCLGTLGALSNLEGYPIALIKGLEPFLLDGRKMYEYVPTAIFRDETKTLLLIEPFDCSLRHSYPLSDTRAGKTRMPPCISEKRRISGTEDSLRIAC